MCQNCKDKLDQIRSSLASSQTPGALLQSYQEYGCWACDGNGNVTNDPFKTSGNAPAWNIYVVSRYGYPGAIVDHVISEATTKAVCFYDKKFTWLVELNNLPAIRWSYTSHDIIHEFSAIEIHPESLRSEEHMMSTFESTFPVKSNKALTVHLKVPKK